MGGNMIGKIRTVGPFLFVALALVACFAVQAAQASTVIVGTCKNGIQFSTIGGAVAASPAGTTVDVCPGFYPEQVAINKALILKGITSGNQGAAIITVPPGGLVQNATSLTSGNAIAAQILVQGTTNVTITNMAVDGANNGITGGCPTPSVPNPIGIYYQNSSGSISHTSVLNEVLIPSLSGCQAGLGIFVQSGGSGTSNVSITNNHVSNYQKNGITGNEVGTNVTISGNTVIGQGPTNGAAENSVQIGFGATGSISSNTVGSDVWGPDNIGDPGDAAAGLLVYDSANVIINKNNVSETQFGIAVVTDGAFPADHAAVTNNTVAATHIFDGIDLCGNNHTVTGNVVNGSDEAAIHIDGSCGPSTGSTVKSNTINSACAGVLIGAGSSVAASSPNTYYNAITLVQNTGSDACSPPPGVRPKTQGVARQRANFIAARP
jgi:hypothetical protein